MCVYDSTERWCNPCGYTLLVLAFRLSLLIGIRTTARFCLLKLANHVWIFGGGFRPLAGRWGSLPSKTKLGRSSRSTTELGTVNGKAHFGRRGSCFGRTHGLNEANWISSHVRLEYTAEPEFGSGLNLHMVKFESSAPVTIFKGLSGENTAHGVEK